MCVFPDAEKSKAPIYRQRKTAEYQPDPRQRADVVKRTEERVENKSEKEPAVDAKTARTDGQFIVVNVKAALGYLVADKSEGIIQVRRRRNKSCLL